MIKKYLDKKLSKAQKRKWRNHLDDFRSLGPGFNLSRIGRIYKTDKADGHNYCEHYRKHFRPYKFRRINFLEIGVGGYKEPFDGGSSLRMWRKYFPFGRIFSIDIYDKKPHCERRIKILQGSQVDIPFLDSLLEKTGPLDLIIDDGSHLNEHVIASFEYLFPKLKDGGLYVVEDTQTSYWKHYGGDSDDMNKEGTMMTFFKGLTDSMNNKEFRRPGYQQSYYDKKIISMHFYHNMVFIYKGDNDEESNIVVNNQI